MWLLESEVFAELRAAMALGFRPTAEQQAEFTALRGRPQQQAGDAPVNYSVSGDTAEIGVVGVLSPRPNFVLWLLGCEQTTYGDIRSSLARASSDPAVKRVSMVVDSPGGTVDGLFETLADVEAFAKPISVTSPGACSAAYAIAAVAGPITATNPAARFGSVGVAVSLTLDEDTVSITSTEAPRKRPDVSTPEGQAVVREHLDALHELFAGAIAGGRSTTVENVNANYGRGATLLAAAAKSRGMIDSIAAQPKRNAARSRVAAEGAGPLTLQAIALCEQAPSADRLLAVAGVTAPKPSTDTNAEAEHDLGDIVADMICGPDPLRAGKPRPTATSTTPSFALPPGKDIGDLVADMICGPDRKKAS